MDETITTPSPIAVSQPVPSYHHKRRWFLIVGSIVLVVLIGLIAWFIIRRVEKKHLAPLETLQQLKSGSQPVKTTTTQRAQILGQASKNSVQYIVTPQQQLNIFNALNK